MKKIISQRILFSIGAMVALVLFCSALAQALEFQFGGQIRPRYNLIDHKGFTGFEPNLAPEEIWTTRVRFDVNIKVNEKNSGFIQFQGTGVWGRFVSATGPRSAIVADDNNFDLGIHQAYFIRHALFGLPVDLQVGRQELVLDGHRLLGNVGWTPGGRSHDGIRLTHAGEDLTVMYMYTKLLEFDSTGLGTGKDTRDDGAFNQGEGDFGDNADMQSHILWANLKAKDSSTSLYFIYIDAGNPNQDLTALEAAGVIGPCSSFSGANCTFDSENSIFTIGARQAGKLFGLDYRAEIYYQFGEAENYTLIQRPLSGFTNWLGYAGYNSAAFGAESNIDRSAYMFGVRVGKRFANVLWKPSITLWYDHLSGTDQDDINDGDFSTFNTLFATQHKYYGHMDLFQTSGVSLFTTLFSSADPIFFGSGISTQYMGLRDLAVKASVQPTKKLLLKADFHWFWTDTDLSDTDNAVLRTSLARFFIASTNAPIASDFNKSPSLGQELDITAIYRFDENFTFSAGYSRYFSTDLFKALNLFNFSGVTANDEADWAFAQFDWKF